MKKFKGYMSSSGRGNNKIRSEVIDEKLFIRYNQKEGGVMIPPPQMDKEERREQIGER